VQSKAKIRTKAGLDIGSSDIKVVEIAEGQGKPVLTAFGRRTPLTSSREETVAAIKAIVDAGKISSKTVNISVSGPPVIVRFITMPRMTRDEMSGAIRFEAEKHIPFNINECVIDFQIMRDYPKENKSDVLLAAAKREHVESRVKMVLEANLSVGVVDIDGFALANAFLKSYPQAGAAAAEKTILLLDIGSTLTNLAILKGAALCLVRDVAVGGKDIAAAIAKAYAIDPKNGDEIRRVAQEKGAEVTAHLKPVLNNLIDEVRLSCSYYENQCGRTVDEIYVAGGAAAVSGLPDYFQESFGLKSAELDAFKAVDTMNVDAQELAKVKSSLAVAMGLAFR